MEFHTIRNFRGISLTPFCLNLNGFDGFGFYLLSITWSFSNPGVATISNQWTLFSVNYMKLYDGKGGWKKRLFLNVAGLFKKEFIFNRLIDIDEIEDEGNEW